MTMPEWAAVIVITAVIGVLTFIAKRIIEGGDEQTAALGKIADQLSSINVKLGEGEIWMKMHAREDDRMFKMISDTHKEMWYVINERRPIEKRTFRDDDGNAEDYHRRG